MYWILDENHNPVQTNNVEEWGRFFHDPEKRVVANDPFGFYTVSTVFLGIDHNFTGIGPPILFETMVFFTDGSMEHYVDRYATWEEAEQGHLQALDWLDGREWQAPANR